MPFFVEVRMCARHCALSVPELAYSVRLVSALEAGFQQFVDSTLLVLEAKFLDRSFEILCLSQKEGTTTEELLRILHRAHGGVFRQGRRIPPSTTRRYEAVRLECFLTKYDGFIQNEVSGWSQRNQESKFT